MTASKTKDLLQIEQICSHFEANWSTDSISLIVDLVLAAESRLQAELADELVSIDLEMRESKNEPINTDDYLLRLPGFSSSIKQPLQAHLQKKPAESDSLSETAPKRIGDFRIVELIGKGGSGIVYEGIQESLGRRVAIKTLSQGHLHSQVSRFHREAKAIALLHHTNIVKVFGSGIDQGTPYFAMQLIEGQNLSELIDAARSDTNHNAATAAVGSGAQKAVARIGLQVARALEHAHQIGVLHRDIKPSNLLLDENGTTWVTDFGMAKIVDEPMHAKTVGVIGTIRYVPPEGFSGQWDERSDVYSLGLTLYELLALKPAIEGADYRQLIKEISNGKPLAQFQKIDGVSKDLETIILKASSQEPARRYRSAGELADELQRYLDGKPIKARPVSFLEKSLSWAKRQPATAALASMILLVAFVGLPVLLWLWLQTNSALTTVQAQRVKENRLQQSIVDARIDAEAAKYSSTSLLTQSFVDRGQANEARRTLAELRSSISSVGIDGGTSMPWEMKYLHQSLDTSRTTLRGNPHHQVWRVAVRPDDKQIATVHSGPFESEIQSEVILWDLETRKQMHVLRNHGSSVYGCSYSHDGQKLATIGMNVEQPGNRGSLCIWNIETGKRICQTKLNGVFENALLYNYGSPILPGVAFSHDDCRIITWPDPVEVRDTATQEILWSCRGRNALILDENRALIYTGDSIQTRDLSSGKVLDEVHNRFYNLHEFQLSADRKKLTCIDTNKMRVWESVDSLSEFIELSIPGINWGSLSPDGTQAIYSARKGELGFENLDRSVSNSERSLLGHEGMINHGNFTQNGKWLITAGVDGTVKTWPTKPQQRIADTGLAHDKFSNLCFSSDSKEIHFVARRQDGGKRPYNAGTVCLEDFKHSTANVESTYRAHWPRGDYSFSPGGKFLAAPISEPGPLALESIRGFSQMGEIGIWKCDSWEKQHSIKAKLSEISSVQLGQNGELLAVAGHDNDRWLIKFLDPNSENDQKIGELEFEEPIIAMALRRSKLAVATKSRVTVWALNRASQNSSEHGQIDFDMQFETSVGGRLVCLDFSPDGTKLVAADHQSDDFLMLDAKSGETLYRRAGPRAVCCAQFSPCGKRLALSGFDSIVHLCDVKSGYRLLTLSGSDTYPGTISINSRVVFSPDGKKIATNNWRGHIRFWNLADKFAD